MDTPDPLQPRSRPYAHGTPYACGAAPRPPQPTDRKAARRKAWLTHGAVAFVALFAGALLNNGAGTEAAAGPGAGSAPAEPTATVTATVTAGAGPAPTATVTATAAPTRTGGAGPAGSIPGDGEFLVGEDIRAGTYRTAGPAKGAVCYWERAEDSSGESGSVIANRVLTGPGRVTLRTGEVFKTNWCRTWTRTG